MIPVYLEFSGLNSYREQQNVDFSQLMAQGLFGIFGVTGAGKSTVLDAMTLALFGQVKRAPHQTQGIINAREKRCRVRFVFELSGHRYAAERVFERVKGDPFSCGIKSCRLVEDDSLVLADKNRVMDDEIEKLLNMDCERFCQTVILPQGQFDQLLHMKPSARSSMLEELFHYQEYGESLVRRCREQTRRKEAELSALDEQLSLLGPCGPEDLERIRQDLEQTREQGRQLTSRLKEAEDERRRLEELEKKAAERSRLERELAIMDAQAETIAALREEERLAREAEPLRHSLEEAVERTKRMAEAQREKDAAQAEQETAKTAKEQAKSEHEALLDSLKSKQAQLNPALIGLELAARRRQEAPNARADWQAARAELAESGAAAAVEQLDRALADIRRAQDQTASALQDLQRLETEAQAGWERALAEERAAERQNAAALLAEGLREGEPCPVCGSRHHLPQLHVPADLKSAAAAVDRAREEWDCLRQAREQKENRRRELSEKEKQLNSSRQRQNDELSRRQALIDSLKQACERLETDWRRQADCDDPAAEGERLRKELDQAATAEEKARQRLEQAERQSMTAGLDLEKANAALAERERSLSELREKLLEQVESVGFPSAREAKNALRDRERQREMAAKLKAYDDKLILNQREFGSLNQALRGFDPQALAPARERAEALGAEQRELLSRGGRLEKALEDAEQAAVRRAELTDRRAEVRARADVLRRLNNLLKGNAFVRYLARGTMLELAHESSDILQSLTAGRYRLELVEDGSDFILYDSNGGLRRQISGLSGGETFLVSLALALALSGKIQMHSAPLGFFFLDEGFGSLDGTSLEAAMAVLEKLPSDKRAVGLITHVREVRERVPRYLEVIADPVRGSRVQLRKN